MRNHSTSIELLLNIPQVIHSFYLTCFEVVFIAANYITHNFISDFCNFENGQCGWQQLPNNDDDFDWIQGGGRTGSSGTGPSTDHTRGLSIGS